MGHTIVRFDDVPDLLGDYPGEMRMLKGALETRQVAVTWRVMPPGTGGKGGYGHRHRQQEEVYVVLRGTLQFKLEDEIVDVPARTAVRVAPETARSVWNEGPDDVELMIASIRLPGDPTDHEVVEDFWPASPG